MLTERGKYNKSMKLDDMKKGISTHLDLMNEKSHLNIFFMIMDIFV